MSLSPSNAPAAAPARDVNQMERLVSAVEETAGQLKVLREALDDIYCELQWAVRNRGAGAEPTITPLTSMPADPLAPDFGARLNRFSAKDLPSEAGVPAPKPAPSPPSPVPQEAPRRSRMPLYKRLFSRPEMIELTRLLGYEGLPDPEFWDRYREMCQQYGQPAMTAAVEEIVEFDKKTLPATAKLTAKARGLAIQLLGPPPGPP